MITGIQPISCW